MDTKSTLGAKIAMFHWVSLEPKVYDRFGITVWNFTYMRRQLDPHLEGPIHKHPDPEEGH